MIQRLERPNTLPIKRLQYKLTFSKPIMDYSVITKRYELYFILIRQDNEP